MRVERKHRVVGNILHLNGRELEAEIERMAKENPIVAPWSEKEVAILRRLHGKVPILVIAKATGRSRGGVQQKAGRLGL